MKQFALDQLIYLWLVMIWVNVLSSTINLEKNNESEIKKTISKKMKK